MLPITIPPIIPDMSPEIKGAPQANAMPRHNGRATRKTTIPAGISFPGWAKTGHLLVLIFALDKNFLRGLFLLKIFHWINLPKK